MTEDEAKKKACPYAKNFGASQRVADSPGPHCVASACMAWRISTPGIAAKKERAETGTTVRRVKIKPPEGDGWVAVQAGRDRPDRDTDLPYRWVVWERSIAAVPGQGYCGLAGEPQ